MRNSTESLAKTLYDKDFQGESEEGQNAMVSRQSVDKQFKRIGFNPHGWGKGEVKELPSILLPDEKILECVNGIYEGGFALLVATDVRLLLIDKKPLNYLTVEDVRFDMITQIDYSHRLLGAQININTGVKNVQFRSYNQPRLRQLISYLQHSMADVKKKESDHQEGQQFHLGQINQQLQTYLLAQHRYQEELRQQLMNSHPRQNKETQANHAEPAVPAPMEVSPELSDYLYAQSLLLQHEQQRAAVPAPLSPSVQSPADSSADGSADNSSADGSREAQQAELHRAAVQEVATRHANHGAGAVTFRSDNPMANPVEVNPLRVAYSRLPMALRSRKFARPSFQGNDQAVPLPTTPELASS